MFNGASNISTEGGLAVLSESGFKESKKLIAYYMDNAKNKTKPRRARFQSFGGENAPYICSKPRKFNFLEIFRQIIERSACRRHSGFFVWQGRGRLCSLEHIC